MDKIGEAQGILRVLGLPAAQQNEISALTLLALCGIRPNDSWHAAKRRSLTVTKGIMEFVAREYGRDYKPNTRETFRRQVLHQFLQAKIVDYNPDDPGLPTNSPHAHYALTEAALDAIRSFGTESWTQAASRFISQQGSLTTTFQRLRQSHLVPLDLPDGVRVELSPGQHNELQAAIVQQFAPRFAPHARLLYLGDTAKKSLHVDDIRLSAIKVPVTQHDKLPDVILNDERRKRLLLIEAVTAHGPMTPSRVMELRALLAECPQGLVFISAFLDMAEFRKHLKDIAWETEVWIAEIPEHMIHFNGDRFLDPRAQDHFGADATPPTQEGIR